MFSDPEPVPGWQERSRARSLAGARSRADEQASRLVRAAEEMVNNELEVTVPALVARAQMSTKTFYRHFSSRDELMLALMEDELAIGAHLVRKEVERRADPVDRLRACVFAFVGLPGRYTSVHVRQARAREGQRLMALYPERAAQANAPLHAVFVDVLGGLADAGLVTLNDPELTARSMFYLLTGHIVDTAADPSADAYERIRTHAWGFCCAALGLPTDAATGGSPVSGLVDEVQQ
jgi:TetR/AcrR family transcriptional regulator